MSKISQQDVLKILETVKKISSSSTVEINPNVFEKDILVTRIIHSIAEVETANLSLVFCGGTCLAKAHQLVKRMSEDIDFKIVPTIPFASLSTQRKQLHDFKKVIIDKLATIGFNIGEENFKSYSNNSYIVYEIPYQSHFDKLAHLKSHIKLEFTLDSLQVLSQSLGVASLVDRILLENITEEKKVACITVPEAAAEKWVALTRRIALLTHHPQTTDFTLVRHLYDLKVLSEHVVLAEPFFRLVAENIQRDGNKFKHHLEYLHNPIAEIRLALTDLHENKIWSTHYANFIRYMVYAEHNPSFAQCYTALQVMSEKIFTRLAN